VHHSSTATALLNSDVVAGASAAPLRRFSPRAGPGQRGHTRLTASACLPDSGRMSSQSTCGYRPSQDRLSARPQRVWLVPRAQACTSPPGRRTPSGRPTRSMPRPRTSSRHSARSDLCLAGTSESVSRLRVGRTWSGQQVAHAAKRGPRPLLGPPVAIVDRTCDAIRMVIGADMHIGSGR
jgi:hypothetical protein